MSENNKNPVEKRSRSTRDNSEKTRAVGRRNVLKGVAIGGVLAGTQVDRWIKPVVETVVLPAHAQTSPTDTTDTETTDSGPSSLSSITLRGTCSDSPDDQFYTVVWSADPPVSGETPTITAVGSDPGTPTGDNLVIFATHSDSFLIAVIRGASFQTNAASVDCSNPGSDTGGFGFLLDSGETFSRTQEKGGTPGEPFITMSGFTAD